MLKYKSIIAVVLFFSLTVVYAELIGPNTSLLEQVILSDMYRAELFKKHDSTPFNPQIECPKIFEAAKAQWSIASKSRKANLMSEGSLRKAFTKDEILKMGAVNPHGLLSKIRGTDKYITEYSSKSGAPGFPHATRGCEKMFKEEMVIREIAGKQCREIKMTLDQKPESYYYQVYCENDSSIRINFAYDNEMLPTDMDTSRDCVFCR